METDMLLNRLSEARKQCNDARKRMDNASSKRIWREAEEDLNFWQGKAAWTEAHLAHLVKETRL